MRWVLLSLLLGGLALQSFGSVHDDFVASAKEKHGEAGERAARFLIENMPPADREKLTGEFLTENLNLAFQARSEFRWAAAVPEELFLNDVLPYAVFDETRDPWRAELFPIARAIVKNARTASEAAQALNRDLFNAVKVHYNTGRKRPNQSLKESVELGKATCTGLSIILVQACRAVGIPARAVGTARWINERGNHTWTEIWDGDWHFTGADEYDAGGLNRGWFVGDAAQAKADMPRYAIYATSWKRDGVTFPMVWARDSDSVAAVNVTTRYAKENSANEAELARLGVRLWDRTGGTRLAAKVCVLDGVRRTCALADTKSGTADLNDMPRFTLKAGAQGWLRFTIGAESRELPFGPLNAGEATVDSVWTELAPASPKIDALRAWLDQSAAERRSDAPELSAPLTREEAARAVQMFGGEWTAHLASERNDELEKLSLAVEGKTIRWLEKTFGEAPPGGRSLWISMHGGGNAPIAVNDKQWQNQINLYEPAEGIYVAPRAPTDTWNLWHESHIDPMFQRLIDNYVALKGVNPNKIYLMGYSAGGDGVWQLAPRMADRFAAAAMMAGHPNEASLLGLRNLPFAIFMGANDGAYNRNKVAAERAAELDLLEKNDPGGYVHFFRLYEDTGHWMKKQDAEALPWMAKFERNPWPQKVVWNQDDIVHHRFYWLQIPAETPIPDRSKIVATADGQTIRLEGDVPPTIRIRLSDQLLDLDKPITVTANGHEHFSGKVTRQASAIWSSLSERADVASAATAILDLR